MHHTGEKRTILTEGKWQSVEAKLLEQIFPRTQKSFISPHNMRSGICDERLCKFARKTLGVLLWLLVFDRMPKKKKRAEQRKALKTLDVEESGAQTELITTV